MNSVFLAIGAAALYLIAYHTLGSRKNNFTFYAPQGHLLRGTS